MLKKDFSKFYILGGLIAATGLLIFLNSFGWLGYPQRVFYWISLPIMRPFQLLGTKSSQLIHLFFNLKELVKENYKLKMENQELLLKIANLSESSQENKLLRQQLQIKSTLKAKMIMADLIGFEPSNFGQFFLINRGLTDGLSLHQAVIFAGGFLVGKITEAQANLSKVTCLTDSQSSVSAVTQETRVSGLVQGDHGVGLIMEIASPQKEIRVGETVISSGLDGYLPKGLIIGQVEKKISPESEAFQKFEIRMSINCQELDKVFVILGNQ